MNLDEGLWWGASTSSYGLYLHWNGVILTSLEKCKELRQQNRKTVKWGSFIVPKFLRQTFQGTDTFCSLMNLEFLSLQPKGFQRLGGLTPVAKSTTKGRLGIYFSWHSCSFRLHLWDLQANQKQVYRNRASKWGNCLRVGADNGTHPVLCSVFPTM